MTDSVAPRFGWQRGEPYEYLKAIERPLFAWEWLRRSDAYRRAWQDARRLDERARSDRAAAFGLRAFIPPEHSAEVARPIWHELVDPRVLPAFPAAAPLEPADRLDIRPLMAWATLTLGPGDVEHWRIGDQAVSVRLDVRAGTLLGGPTPLAFPLQGLERLRPKLDALAALLRLVDGRPPLCRPEARAHRWIAELRVADAIAAGATQQQMARVLLGRAVPQKQWRAAGESHRLRIQRLVRSARARLAVPLAPAWFR